MRGGCRSGERVKEAEVLILNRWDDMPIATNMLNRFGADNGLTPSGLHDLNVVLDEALNNIIAYGHEGGAQDEIKVRLEYQNDRVTIVIEDRGRPFDPLQVPAPDLASPLRARKIGGLGVHFMRSLVDEMTYASTDGTNRLCLVKKFTT